MKIAALPWKLINPETTRSPLTIEEWVKAAAEIGLDGIELSDNDSLYLEEKNKGRCKDLKKLIFQEGLAVSMITTQTDFVDSLRVEKQHERLYKYFEVAHFFETEIVRVTAGKRDKKISRQEVLDGVISHFKRIAEKAGSHNLKMALENHGGIEQEKDDYLYILQNVGSPRFGANFDVKNPLRTKQDPYDFLKAIIPWIFHVHLCNFKWREDKWNLAIPLDKGDVDIRKMLRIMKCAGYDGWLSIEYGGENLDDIDRSAKFVREIWKQIQT